MKKPISIIAKLSLLIVAAAALGNVLAISLVSAQAKLNGTAQPATDTPQQQQRLQDIITKGDKEIERRLDSLSKLSERINDAKRLSASEKAVLQADVSSTVSGLNSLKTTLDAETTLSAARTDAQNIYVEYRVYALLMPKIALMKVADDQQTNEANLTNMYNKLQQTITNPTSTQQSELSDMINKINAAQSISSSVESAVEGLTPSDYNTNHSVLSGYGAKLSTARSDNQQAFKDARELVSSIKK